MLHWLNRACSLKGELKIDFSEGSITWLVLVLESQDNDDSDAYDIICGIVLASDVRLQI